MGKYLLLAAFIGLLPGMAWGPIHAYKMGHLAPQGWVLYQAQRHNVPAPLALTIWQLEASQRVNVRDGDAGERGAFQVTEAAADDMKCPWLRMRAFRVSVNCGMRYLAAKIKSCRSHAGAAHAYNWGHCPRKGKIWGYGQEAGKLAMKYSKGWEGP